MKTGNILLLIGLLLCTSSFLTACNSRVQENGRKRTLFNGTVYAQNTAIQSVILEGQEFFLIESVAGIGLSMEGFFLKDSVFIRSHILQYIPEISRFPWHSSEFDDLEEGQSYWILDFYSLPDGQKQRRIKSRFPVAIQGNFHQFITIPTPDTTLLFYLLGWKHFWSEDAMNFLGAKQHLFAIDLSGNITHFEGITIPYSLDRVTPITHIGNNDFVYQHDSLIVRASKSEKKSSIDTLFHIPHDPHRGHLLVNTKQNRIVFAHHFHHLFHIMDLSADTVKTVDLNNGVHRRYDRRYQAYMGPIQNPNPEYFVDAFAGENYFYLLFRGHSEFWNSNVVEQYDWNGNHVARYFLEGNPVGWFGGFWVDERNQQFYILAVECRGEGWSRRCTNSLMVYANDGLKHPIYCCYRQFSKAMHQ